jgi:hypothetical protein
VFNHIYTSNSSRICIIYRNGRKGYVALGCQRGGQYWEYPYKKREANITLKCDCPFKLKSYLLSSGCWSLNVVNGEHNHNMTQKIYKYAKRLRPDEKELVQELTKYMAAPRNIMSTLRSGRQQQLQPSNTSTMHIIEWSLLIGVRGQRCSIWWGVWLKATTCSVT